MNTRMIDLGNHRAPLHIIDTATSIDCTKDVPLRRSLRSLIDIMLPCCGFHPSLSSSSDFTDNDSTTITFFGYRRGRVSFCLQSTPQSTPLLLLDLAVPTAYLAREMRHGLLRIALKTCSRSSHRCPLFAVPAWTMYLNGRKLGFAVRRADTGVLKTMQSISVGAGMLDDELMYLRARFERVVGSVDSESFHMINPVGSSGQELSIFLSRS